MTDTTPYTSITQKVTHTGVIIAVIIGGLFYLYGKKMDVRTQTPATITVTGDGKVSAAPDIAQVSFGIQTGPQTSANGAVTILTTKMKAVIEAVKKAGIPDKDMTTEQFSLNPTYDWTGGVQRLRGYDATQMLRVKIRDLDKVGDILSAATAAGANQAGNMVFVLDDPNAVQAQAREKAIAEAKEKAKVLAGQLGVNLGRIVSFNEGGGYAPPMPYMMRNEAMGMGGGGDASLQVPVGEQDTVVSVSITYELR